MHLVMFVKGRRVPVGSKSKSGKSVKVAEGRWRPVKNREQLPKKITSKVVVPPAWVNVQYFTDPKSKLLVKGEDSKGRTQYLYNPAHVTDQSKAKFARIRALNKAYDGIMDENLANVRKKDEAAICLSLILLTGIRPGSEKETKGNAEAFGATTLQGQHVKDGGKRLEFVGKKGVKLSIPVTNPRAIALLKTRKRKAGKNGRLFNVTGDQLLRYTKSLGGDAGFQTKDFRTHLGTQIAMKAKRGLKPKTMKEYKKAVIKVADKVAAKLGNTRKVALSSYINPAIFEKWRASVEGT